MCVHVFELSRASLVSSLRSVSQQSHTTLLHTDSISKAVKPYTVSDLSALCRAASFPGPFYITVFPALSVFSRRVPRPSDDETHEVTLDELDTPRQLTLNTCDRLTTEHFRHHMRAGATFERGAPHPGP